MRLVVKKLANQRKPKTDKALVRTTPTEGTIHMNSNAVKVMGINYNQVNSDEGLRAEIAIVGETAEGKPQFAVFVHQPGATTGCKLSATGKNKYGALQFNSASIWKEMGGNDEQNVIFEITEEANAVMQDEDGDFVSYADAIENGFLDENGCYTETDEENGEVEGEPAVVAYLMTFLRAEDKPVRTKSSDSADDADDAEDDEDEE